MTVTVVLVRALADELRRQSIDPIPLLRRAEIEPATLASWQNRVSKQSFGRLVEASLTASREPALGFLSGLRTSPFSLPFVGPLMLFSPSLREALSMLSQFGHLALAEVRWTLEQVSDTSEFVFWTDNLGGALSRFTHEYVSGMSINIGSVFARSAVTGGLTRLRLTHNSERGQDFFSTQSGVVTQLGANRNGLEFSTALLDIEQTHPDVVARDMLLEAANEVVSRHRAGAMAARLRTFLRYRRDLRDVTLDTLSAHVGLSPRLLQRRLAAEGQSVREILSEARCRVALDQLSNFDCSIKELAARAGFADVRSFNRAFRRWRGRTPAQERAALARGRDDSMPHDRRRERAE